MSARVVPEVLPSPAPHMVDREFISPPPREDHWLVALLRAKMNTAEEVSVASLSFNGRAELEFGYQLWMTQQRLSMQRILAPLALFVFLLFLYIDLNVLPLTPPILATRVLAICVCVFWTAWSRLGSRMLGMEYLDMVTMGIMAALGILVVIIATLRFLAFPTVVELMLPQLSMWTISIFTVGNLSWGKGCVLVLVVHGCYLCVYIACAAQGMVPVRVFFTDFVEYGSLIVGGLWSSFLTELNARSHFATLVRALEISRQMPSLPIGRSTTAPFPTPRMSP
jgi:hypothetical protein